MVPFHHPASAFLWLVYAAQLNFAFIHICYIILDSDTPMAYNYFTIDSFDRNNALIYPQMRISSLKAPQEPCSRISSQDQFAGHLQQNPYA